MACLGASLGAVHFFKTISANDDRCELLPINRSRNEFLLSPPDAALPRDCLDFRVMPASLSLSSMEVPILRPRIVAYGAALSSGVRVAPGAARNWGRGDGVLGQVAPRCFCRQLFYLDRRRWTGLPTSRDGIYHERTPFLTLQRRCHEPFIGVQRRLRIASVLLA